MKAKQIKELICYFLSAGRCSGASRKAGLIMCNSFLGRKMPSLRDISSHELFLRHLYRLNLHYSCWLTLNSVSWIIFDFATNWLHSWNCFVHILAVWVNPLIVVLPSGGLLPTGCNSVWGCSCVGCPWAFRPHPLLHHGILHSCTW